MIIRLTENTIRGEGWGGRSWRTQIFLWNCVLENIFILYDHCHKTSMINTTWILSLVLFIYVQRFFVHVNICYGFYSRYREPTNLILSLKNCEYLLLYNIVIRIICVVLTKIMCYSIQFIYTQ